MMDGLCRCYQGCNTRHQGPAHAPYNRGLNCDDTCQAYLTHNNKMASGFLSTPADHSFVMEEIKTTGALSFFCLIILQLLVLPSYHTCFMPNVENLITKFGHVLVSL